MHRRWSARTTHRARRHVDAGHALLHAAQVLVLLPDVVVEEVHQVLVALVRPGGRHVPEEEKSAAHLQIHAETARLRTRTPYSTTRRIEEKKNERAGGL